MGALSKKPKLPTFFDTYGGTWTGRNAQGRHRITFLVLAGPSSMAVHVQYCAASPTLWGEQKPHNMALLCNHVITNNH